MLRHGRPNTCVGCLPKVTGVRLPPVLAARQKSPPETPAKVKFLIDSTSQVQSPENSPVGLVNVCTYNFCVCGPQFKFLTSDVGVVVVDHLHFRFSLFRSVAELFLLKFENVRNRAEFWTFYALPNFDGAPLPNVVPTLSRLPRSSSPSIVS